MSAEFLKKIAVAIENKQSNVFLYPVKKQQAYVEHFPTPKDGIERGYFQYCCQMKLYGEPLHACLNVAALPLAVYYLLKFRGTCGKDDHTPDAVFFPEGKPLNIIPDSLSECYKDIATISSEDRCLTKTDRAFLQSVFRRYPFSWMLWLKLILKVAQYSHAITKYSPDAIISCNEFSYTAPILTEYCHMRGIKSINVMHGEKLYYMRDTFSKYDAFYVWGQEYADLFTALGGDKDQYIVALPQSLRIKNHATVEKKYDYTYYLARETGKPLELIAQMLKKLNEKGKRISIRPHPRYSDIHEVNARFPFANVEDTKTVTIEQSLLQTNAAVSVYSTVLYQAYHNGIDAVVDDVSAPEQFASLKERRYVMFSLKHRLLSELMEEIE